MKKHLLLIAISLTATLIYSQETMSGFFDFRWNEEKGTIEVDVTDRMDEEFLYVNSLSSGVGSNDIGLDRNQLGGERVVVVHGGQNVGLPAEGVPAPEIVTRFLLLDDAPFGEFEQSQDAQMRLRLPVPV